MGRQVGPAGGRTIRQGLAGTGRQQCRHRHTVGRPRPGGPGDRVLGGRNRRQRCTTLRRLIVHTSVAEDLVDRIIAAYRQLPVGDPAADGTLVGPLIHETAYRDMVSALDRARADGGEVIGGDRQEIGGPAGGTPTMWRPPSSACRHRPMSSTTRLSPHSLRRDIRDFRRSRSAQQRCTAGTFVCGVHHRRT